MLQFLRAHATSWAMKILLGVLVLSFGLFWGISEFFRGPGGDSVATIDRQAISKEYLRRMVDEQLKRLAVELKGKHISFHQAQQVGLVDQTLQRVINEIIIDLYIKHTGLTASDQILVAMISSDPAFQNASGQFDRDRFQQLLRANGFSEQSFLQSRRKASAQMQLFTAISAGKNIPASLAMKLFKAFSEERTFQLYSFIPSTITIPDNPTELETYYTQNKKKFEVPEVRDVTLIFLDPLVMGKKFSFAEKEVHNAYVEQAENFLVPEKRDLIIVRGINPEEAMKAHALLKKGKPTDKERTTVLKSVLEKDLQRPIGSLAFSLGHGQVSAPLKVENDFYVVKVQQITPPATAPLAQIRPKVVAELQRQKGMEEVATVSQKIEDKMNQGMALEEIAKELKLPIRKLSLNQRGQDRDGKPLNVQADIVRDIFTLPAQSENPVTELSDNTSYVVRVDVIHRAHIPELSAIKDKVKALWLHQKRLAVMREKANEFKTTFAQGQAAPFPMKIQKLPPFSLMTMASQSLASFPLVREVIQKGFTIKKGDIAVIESADTLTVVVPVTIKTLDVEDHLPLYNQFKNELEQGMQRETLEEFVHSLREVFSVKINKPVLDQMDTY